MHGNNMQQCRSLGASVLSQVGIHVTCTVTSTATVEGSRKVPSISEDLQQHQH